MPDEVGLQHKHFNFDNKEHNVRSEMIWDFSNGNLSLQVGYRGLKTGDSLSGGTCGDVSCYERKR